MRYKLFVFVRDLFLYCQVLYKHGHFSTNMKRNLIECFQSVLYFEGMQI